VNEARRETKNGGQTLNRESGTGDHNVQFGGSLKTGSRQMDALGQKNGNGDRQEKKDASRSEQRLSCVQDEFIQACADQHRVGKILREQAMRKKGPWNEP